MSDDLLHDDLTRLAHRAELGAGAIAPAEAIVGRAKRRRRNLRLFEGTLALVVVAAAATGIVLSRPADHQNVAVGANGNRNHGAELQPGHRPAEGTGTSYGKDMVGAATMRVEKSATGTTCAVVTDPATAAADADRRGGLRAGATGVSAVWLPNRPTNGVCRSTVTSSGTATAASLAKAIETASRAKVSCAISTLVPGRVELVFSYATGRPWAVVTVTLGSCPDATLPNGQERWAGTVRIADLDEPAWATGSLQFKSTGTSRVGHQKLSAGG